MRVQVRAIYCWRFPNGKNQQSRLEQRSIGLILEENPKWEKTLKEMLERDDVPTVAETSMPEVLAWTQEEIGKATSLDQSAVSRVLCELPKREKSIIEMLERDDVPDPSA